MAAIEKPDVEIAHTAHMGSIFGDKKRFLGDSRGISEIGPETFPGAGIPHPAGQIDGRPQPDRRQLVYPGHDGVAGRSYGRLELHPEDAVEANVKGRFSGGGNRFLRPGKGFDALSARPQKVVQTAMGEGFQVLRAVNEKQLEAGGGMLLKNFLTGDESVSGIVPLAQQGEDAEGCGNRPYFPVIAQNGPSEGAPGAVHGIPFLIFRSAQEATLEIHGLLAREDGVGVNHLNFTWLAGECNSQ